MITKELGEASPTGIVTAGVDVRSEYATLRTVLVHEPGSEIERLRPGNIASLLFEEVPELPRMKEEHRIFVQLMVEQGVEVLRLSDLLSLTLARKNSLRRLVAASCSPGANADLANLILDHYAPEEIKEILFSGLSAEELYARTGKLPGGPNGREAPFVLSPIPNAYFSRDPAAVLNDQVVLGKMHYAARRREPSVLQEALRSDPRFAQTPFIYDDDDEAEGRQTIEGGDILIINRKAIAIGCGERTRAEGVAELACRLFRAGLAERVYQINIPAARVYMHLDTLLTILDEGLVVAYSDVMDEIKVIRRYERGRQGETEVTACGINETRSFKSIFEEEFGHLEVIHTGNKHRKYAALEQQARGTNVFAIGPSTVIAYEHNPHTNDALAAAGVKVLACPGIELVHGLGGPRCMAMPLRRRTDEARGVVRPGGLTAVTTTITQTPAQSGPENNLRHTNVGRS